MGFSGFEEHWNTAFHAMSFTNKTVTIMVGVPFSLQRNQEVWVSSWGAALSLEATNQTEWLVLGTCWSKDGEKGCEGLLPKPAPLPPLTQRGGRDHAEPEQLFIPRLGWKMWLITGKKWDHSEAELLPGWCLLSNRIALPLVSGGVGRRRMGFICSKGSLSSLDMGCSDIWTQG